jgi:hypothetical protein
MRREEVNEKVVPLRRNATRTETDRSREVRGWIKEQAQIDGTPVAAITIILTAEGQILTDSTGIEQAFARVLSDEARNVARSLAATADPQPSAKVHQLRS